jgi:hypothetical protein
MCLLSAGAGWLVAALVFWLFGWYSRDVRRMSLGEMLTLLNDLRIEFEARNQRIDPNPVRGARDSERSRHHDDVA